MRRRPGQLNKWLTSTVDEYIKKYDLSIAPIVYDVGSRDGRDGVELAYRIYSGINLWKDAQIILFECNPPQQEVIERSYPQATLIREAISDKKGTSEFLQIKGDDNMRGSSTLNTKRNDSWIRKTETIKVNTRRLDSVIKELKHEKTEIDIMKVDIEGYSYEALQSLGKYLRNVKVYHIETEIEGYARKHTNLDIALFMENNGYKCVSIEGEWLPNIEDHVYVREDK